MSTSYNHSSPGGPDQDALDDASASLAWHDLVQRFEADIEDACFAEWLDDDLLELEVCLKRFATPSASKLRRS